MDFDLDDTIRTLTNEHGEKRHSRAHGTEFMAIPKERRKDILRHLVNTAKNLKEEKEFFKKPTVREKICKSVFPEALTDKWDKKKTSAAYGVVQRELDEVLSEVWPSKTFLAEETKKMEEWNPAKHGRLGKPFDESALEQLPMPVSNQDEEANELLGFTNE